MSPRKNYLDVKLEISVTASEIVGPRDATARDVAEFS